MTCKDLRVNDNVLVYQDPRIGRPGYVLDAKWNMVLVQFTSGDQSSHWVECRIVYRA